MTRVILDGKGQALDGDSTTTGATCIASGRSYLAGGQNVLREGDTTTECPECGEPGVVVEGCPHFLSDDRMVATDGALVSCGCSSGANRVVAPLHESPGNGRVFEAGTANAESTTSTSTPTPQFLQPRLSQPASLQPTSPEPMFVAPLGTLEPGFFIVPRSMSGPGVLLYLADQQLKMPIEYIKRLNPTFDEGFKAGEMFVLADPNSQQACSWMEAKLMKAAEDIRQNLSSLSPTEASTLVRYQAQIAGLLADTSLSMGVTQAMMAKALSDLERTLESIVELHQREFGKHGHLRSPEFLSERRALFKKLDAQLKLALLNKYMDLGSYDRLRSDLGLSTKSMVHHWSKAGGPGQIPGYATHLDKVAKMVKYLSAGGYIGIGLGGVSSYLKVEEVCRYGETAACRQIRVIEAGGFAGGLGGGAVGGAMASKAVGVVCIGFGPVGAIVCGVAVVGAGSLAGSIVGASAGEHSGRMIYELSNNE